jgi:DnaK suppressor protein
MDIAERLERELKETAARLRNDVTVVLMEEGAEAAADARGINDEVDGAQRSVERDMSLAAHSRLRERAHRLLGALERLREGLYGVCEECDEPIAPARLTALPEVTTCLRCQDRRERLAARGGVERATLLDDEIPDR